MDKKRKRFEIRVSDEQMALLKRTAQARGYRSVGAYVSAVALKDARDAMAERTTGEAFAASLDRVCKELRTLHSAQQAVFATVDSLARLFLTCIPEPSPNTLDQAKRRAKLRYDRFLLSVAQNMAADARATLVDLVDRG